VNGTAALEAVERIVSGGGEADDVLRRVVHGIVEQGGFAWAGILFVEEGRLVLGPEAGDADDNRRVHVPVSYRGDRVAELGVDGAAESDGPALERIAALIGGYCLVGWDTGGEAWVP
jgi:hypothetical protein